MTRCTGATPAAGHWASHPPRRQRGPHADAYLWVKRPGESDGSCGRGEPGAGTFVNQYAIEPASNAGR